MNRREAIRDIFDALADAIGRVPRAQSSPWLAKACDKLVADLAAFAGACDAGDISVEELRSIGEAARDELPNAFRVFGAVVAYRLFDE